MAKKAATRQKSPAASVAGRLGGQGARFPEADEENLWHGSQPGAYQYKVYFDNVSLVAR